MDSTNKLLINHYRHNEHFFFHIDKCALDKEFELHTHDFSELVVILKGKAIHMIDGEEYPIEAGHVYVINGDTSHGYKTVDGIEYFNVMFLPEQLLMDPELKKIPGYHGLFVWEPFYRKVSKQGYMLKLSIEDLTRVERILDRITGEVTFEKNGYIPMIRALFSSLAIDLSRLYIPAKTEPTQKVHSISETVAFIENNYTCVLNLENIATMAHLSKRHFIRIFKYIYGVTPMDYVIHLRLQKACSLLVNNDLKISEIALECGFNDSNYFSRLFKSVYQTTPTAYRVLK